MLCEVSCFLFCVFSCFSCCKVHALLEISRRTPRPAAFLDVIDLVGGRLLPATGFGAGDLLLTGYQFPCERWSICSPGLGYNLWLPTAPNSSIGVFL